MNFPVKHVPPVTAITRRDKNGKVLNQREVNEVKNYINSGKMGEGNGKEEKDDDWYFFNQKASYVCNSQNATNLNKCKIAAKAKSQFKSLYLWTEYEYLFSRYFDYKYNSDEYSTIQWIVIPDFLDWVISNLLKKWAE